MSWEARHKTKFGITPNKTPKKSGLVNGTQKEKDNGHLTKKEALRPLIEKRPLIIPFSIS